MSILGLDIGTTGVKAVAFREDGTFLTSAYREYNLSSPEPGALELDATAVLASIQQVTAEVSAATRDDPIRSLATSTLGEAAVPVDGDAKPLANAIVGFDSRGEELAQAFRERISSEDVFRIAGHGINSAHTLFKILWRRENEPELFERTDKFLCFGDFNMASMGVEPHIDYSMAARTLAFDVHQLDWSDEILSTAGLAREKLARTAAPGTACGEIGAAASEAFGLPKGAVVSAGLHDQPAGILGTGIRPGESMLATGTVTCLGIHLKAPPKDLEMAKHNLCYYPTVGEGQYISIAYNFTGGSLLKWYRDHLAGPELVEAEKRGVDPYEVITASLPEEPTGLIVLPYFTTTGTPYLDPHALGTILGLRLTTTRGELIKGLLEGLLYEMRLNHELLAASGIEIDLYKAIGGAAKSKVWMQIAADVLNRPIAITSVTEGAALGAALVGARGAGIVASEEEMAEIITRAAPVAEVLEPRPEHAERYAERFEIYREVYPATRDLTHRVFRLK